MKIGARKNGVEAAAVGAEVLDVLVLIGEGLGAQEEHVIAVLGRWVVHPDPSLKRRYLCFGGNSSGEDLHKIENVCRPAFWR